MTISNTDTSVTVQGDGLTTVFNYTFYMGGSATYAVLVYIDADGAETAISSADFSITGVTSQSGGTFTYLLSGSPIATGTQLRLSRVLPLVQNAAIGNQGNFYPSVVEGALDYLTMVSQQQSLSGTLDPSSLFGNSTTASAAGAAIPIGSGLSFSGNTLVVSGISGSGTVTEISSGTGLTGGPVTGVGTLSLSSVTSGFFLGNFSGASAAPQGVQLLAGAGLTFSSTTTALTLAAVPAIALISELSAAVVTASFTFSSITSSYRDLEIRVRGRGDTAAIDAEVRTIFNGDTGSTSYTLEQIFGAAAGSFVQDNSEAYIKWLQIAAATTTAGSVGSGSMMVFDYRGTVFFKQVATLGGQAITTSGQRTLATSGQWNSTSAITSVTVYLSAGNFITGSICSLYGHL